MRSKPSDAVLNAPQLENADQASILVRFRICSSALQYLGCKMGVCLLLASVRTTIKASLLNSDIDKDGQQRLIESVSLRLSWVIVGIY